MYSFIFDVITYIITSEETTLPLYNRIIYIEPLREIIIHY